MTNIPNTRLADAWSKASCCVVKRGPAFLIGAVSGGVAVAVSRHEGFSAVGQWAFGLVGLSLGGAIGSNLVDHARHYLSQSRHTLG